MKANYQHSNGEQVVLTLRPDESLRDTLIKAGRAPHNSSRFASCQGFGTCGTCAVQIVGKVEPEAPGAIEAWRLGFPPHTHDSGLRLACQVKPLGDLSITKHEGYWGHQVPKATGPERVEEELHQD